MAEPGAAGPRVLPARDPASIEVAVGALLAGAIVGLPTETLYGLAVLPLPDSLERLVAAKRRSQEKGIPLLVDGLDQVALIVRVPEAAHRLALRLWPGALTLALPLRQNVDLPELLTGGRPTLGVRIPDHPVPRALARRLGPIAVTSANLSGEPPALTAAQLIGAVGASLALVLDDGPVRGGVASTVVGFDQDDRVTFFRVGALSEAAVRAAAESPAR